MASRRVPYRPVSQAAVAEDCFSNGFQGFVSGQESRNSNRPETRIPPRFRGCQTGPRRCRAMPFPTPIRETNGGAPVSATMPAQHEFRPRLHFLFGFRAASRLRPLRRDEASPSGNGVMRGMGQRATGGGGGARSDGGATAARRGWWSSNRPPRPARSDNSSATGYRVMATRGHVRDLRTSINQAS